MSLKFAGALIEFDLTGYARMQIKVKYESIECPEGKPPGNYMRVTVMENDTELCYWETRCTPSISGANHFVRTAIKYRLKGGPQ